MSITAWVLTALLIGSSQDGGEVAQWLDEARALLDAGQSEQARQRLAGVLEQHPGHVNALLILARSWMDDNPSQARLTAVKVLRLEPTNTQALLALTTSYVAARSRGVDHASELRLRRTEVQDYENVLESAPGQADVLYRLASQRLALERLLAPSDATARTQQIDAAIAELRKLQGLLSAQENPSGAAAAAYQLGRALKHRGDFNKAAGTRFEALYSEALQAFNSALEIDAERLDALGEIVLVHQAMAASDSALTAVRAHAAKVESKPASAKLESLLGNLLVETDQADAALAAFERALALDDRFMDTYVGLFKLHQRAGRNDEALEVMRRASIANPRFIAAYIQAGQLLAAEERWSEAIEQFENVFKVAAQDATVLGMVPSPNTYRNGLYYSAGSWLAWLYLQHADNPSGALQAAGMATRFQRAEPYLLDTIGWSHHRLGEHEQARTILEQTVERATGMASAHYHLAAVLAELGQREAALKSAERALALKDPFSERNEAELLATKLRAD